MGQDEKVNITENLMKSHTQDTKQHKFQPDNIESCTAEKMLFHGPEGKAQWTRNISKNKEIFIALFYLPQQNLTNVGINITNIF